MGRKGFTLIELLVVIAIIAVLAAILFPVFITVRDKGRQASCATNAKQLALAWMSYTHDHNDVYPWTNDYRWPYNKNDPDWRYPPELTYGWADAIAPYVKNSKVFTCPTTQGWTSVSIKIYSAMMYMRGYGINAALGRWWVGKVSGIAEPTRTVLLGDCALNCMAPYMRYFDKEGTNGGMDTRYTWGSYCHAIDLFYWKTPAGYTCPLGSPHLGGINVAFVDGHIRHVKDDDIVRWLPGSPR